MNITSDSSIYTIARFTTIKQCHLSKGKIWRKAFFSSELALLNRYDSLNFYFNFTLNSISIVSRQSATVDAKKPCSFKHLLDTKYLHTKVQKLQCFHMFIWDSFHKILLFALEFSYFLNHKK